MNQTKRNRNIDIIRGVALLGIFAANATDMAYPENLVLDLHYADPSGGWNYWAGFFNEVLITGKMRGLFTLLFGVSSVLIIDKLVEEIGESAATRRYFRRLGWLLIFGLINTYLFLWWGDVLFKYALLGVALYAFRHASSRIILAGVLFCLAVLTVRPYFEYREVLVIEQEYTAAVEKQRLGHDLDSADRDVLAQWQDIVLDTKPDHEWIAEELEVKSGSYYEIFNYNIPVALEEQTRIFVTEDICDMLLYMLLGIVLLRLNYFDDAVPQIVHLLVAMAGVGLGLAVHLWMNLGIYTHFYDPVSSFFYPVFFDPGRLFFVLGYVSLIILVFRAGIFSKAGDWMVAVGRMALSNYLLQSVVGALIFYGFGLALFNQLTRLELAAVVLLVWSVQLVASITWMKWFCYGPVEWLWRSLVQWQMPPLRRRQADGYSGLPGQNRS